jgi:hypothetical protein
MRNQSGILRLSVVQRQTLNCQRAGQERTNNWPLMVARTMTTSFSSNIHQYSEQESLFKMETLSSWKRRVHRDRDFSTSVDPRRLMTSVPLRTIFFSGILRVLKSISAFWMLKDVLLLVNKKDHNKRLTLSSLLAAIAAASAVASPALLLSTSSCVSTAGSSALGFVFPAGVGGFCPAFGAAFFGSAGLSQGDARASWVGLLVATVLERPRPSGCWKGRKSWVDIELLLAVYSPVRLGQR